MAKPNKCIIKDWPWYQAISSSFLSARINCYCKNAEREAGSGVGVRDQSVFSAVVGVWLALWLPADGTNGKQARRRGADWPFGALYGNIDYSISTLHADRAVLSILFYSRAQRQQTPHIHSNTTTTLFNNECEPTSVTSIGSLPLPFVCFKLTFLQAV